jgi:predicted metal-dependent hydrolase
VEPVSEEPLPAAETLISARSLVEAGRPFAAHEVLEARWKAGPAEERNLWQGLAQICVALTHAARGNQVGALRLFERGVARLEEYGSGDGPTYGLDPPAVVRCARDRMLIQ